MAATNALEWFEGWFEALRDLHPPEPEPELSRRDQALVERYAMDLLVAWTSGTRGMGVDDDVVKQAFSVARMVVLQGS